MTTHLMSPIHTAIPIERLWGESLLRTNCLRLRNLDLLILQSLVAGEMHGLGVSRRIEQITALAALSSSSRLPLPRAASHGRRRLDLFFLGRLGKIIVAQNTTASRNPVENSWKPKQALGPHRGPSLALRASKEAAVMSLFLNPGTI